MHLLYLQQDHILDSLYNLLKRYNPPVDKHRVQVRFVPVVPKNASNETIQDVLKFDPELAIHL